MLIIFFASWFLILVYIAAAAASSGESGANAEGIPAGSVGETVPSGVSGAEANGATASAPVLATTTLATAAPLGHTGAVPSETAGAAKPQQQMQQQHAISYVTTIRNRFQNEPDTYRAFLKILHTYQKEQKGIKDVLEQVSQLFADHSDLLMEFTYFLPDAVQEQAKERLQRAAREADLRRHRNNMQFGAGGPMSTGKQGMLPMGGMSMGVLPMHPAASGRGAGSNKRQRNNERSASAAASMTDYQSQMMMMQQRNAVGFNVPGGGISPMSGSAMQNMQNMHYYNQQQQQFLSRQQQQQAPAVKGANGTGSRAKQARRKNGVDEPVAANAQVGPNGMVRKDNMSSVTILPPQPPQYNHLNVTAERRFFDQVKDFLYSISRESWHEFVRILELYSQEAVTKKDMLSLAEDLFGSAGSELFDEFKSLMNARVAYDTQGQDIWYGVPSSEIDFSQSRKCTPSYRALPKQYPKPICSARSEMEASVLNDEWVSIPIGSEESFSFKHMRKNQYEEALFRLEDERFEIDMVIDSNMCTIRVLEPMAEEIKLIKGLADTIQANAQGTKSAAASNTKLFNTKFNLQLDNRNISTIHLNAISRIYGDHGAEILELLRKNPATTIPTILLRLKQKDVEWRKARLELNNQWKDLLNKNYERSLDHSSYFFKLQDKKHYSARNLVADVKGVEVTNNQPMLPGTREDLLKQPGISFSVPKSESGKESSTADMNTSLALNYNNKSHAIHKDVYKIICHAAECTPSLSPFDKERIAALWRDLLRVFFNIPVTYMYGNLDENVQITPELIENTTINKDVDANTSDTWSVNTKVITLFGSGVIQSHNSDTKMYGVLLPKYGLVNMKPSCVIGAEELSISALNAIGVNRAQINDPTSDTIVNVPTLAELMASDKQALSAADLEELHRVQLSASAEPVENPSKIFYGTQMCYVFFRLHHTLFNRLEILQQLALDAEKKDLSSNRLSERGSTHKHPINPSYVYVPPTADNCDSSVAEETTVTPSTTPVNGEAESKVIEKKPVYPTFLGMVQSFVSGSMDTAG